MSVEKFTMPSGESCFYKDKDHTYWAGYDEDKGTCSGRLAGISTIAKNDGDPSTDGLVSWGAGLAKRGIWWEDEMNRKADIGNGAHNVLERLCEGEMPPFSGGHELAVIDWFKKTRPEVVMQEFVVYEHEQGYAGRADLMFNPDSPRLLDLKTGSIRSPAMIQLNLYRLACRSAGYPVPSLLLILDTADDGSWQEIQVPIRTDWAIKALQIYKAGKEMRSTLTQAKKTARRGVAAQPEVLA